MESLYLLIPLSLLLVAVIALIFWWSLRSGQYEDMEGPGYRILMDDDSAPPDTSRKELDVDQNKPRGQ